MSLFSDDAAAVADARMRGRRVGWLLMALTLFGVFGLTLLPSPYVIERPGPVFDTLGTVTVEGEEVALIQIPDQPTFATSGSLSLLTVNVFGNRDTTPSWFEVARAWVDPTQSVVPLDSVFPPGLSTEERRERSRIDMENSQQEAVAAALRHLGEDFDSEVVVVETIDDGPAAGILQPDDLILAVNGTPVFDVTALRAAIAENGTESPATLTIERGGVERSVDIVPERSEGVESVPVVGIYVSGRYDFPFEVEIQLENVGGPSAGMMFALGITDKLTPGELTGGEEFAGTGTIAADGTVGPIGGIVQKMYGAVDAGAEWFLAPTANCAEVVGSVPSGLEVFAVSSLDDALEVLDVVANDGELETLARCER